MQVKYCRLETRGESCLHCTLIITSATSSHRKVLFSDVKPLRLYNNAPPPNHHHSRTVQQKTFLKNLTQKKGDMIERQCPKERKKKKPSSVRKLQKKQTTHIEANTPLCDFLMPSEVYV